MSLGSSSSSSSPEPPEPMDLDELSETGAEGLEEAVRGAVGDQGEKEDEVDLGVVARQFAEYLVVDSKQDVSEIYVGSILTHIRCKKHHH